MSTRPGSTALAVLLLAGVARADGDLAVEFRLEADDEGDGNYTALSEMDAGEHFSRGRCICGSRVQYHLTSATSETHSPETVQVWVGSACDTDDTAQRDANCVHLSDLDFSTTALSSYDLRLTVDLMFRPADPPIACDPSIEREETLWLLVDEDGNESMFEHEQDTTTYLLDFQPPTLDDQPVAKGSEDGFKVEWSINEAEDDIRGYQVLCAQNGQPVFPNPPSAEYELSQQLCGEIDMEARLEGGGNPAADGGLIDGGTTADAAVVGGGILDLDPRFVCSGLATEATTETRVSVPAEVTAAGGIDVYLAVIDEHRNARLYFAGADIQPEPVTDFWEAYGHQGGKAKGGFCTITPTGTTGARPGLGAAALLLLGAVAWLARARRRLPLALGIALAAPALASAQVVLDEDTEQDPSHIPTSAWVFELKFGPYYPDVDGEEGLSGKPFETTFGAKENFLTQVELDRFFLWPFGQLGLGVSAGYMQDTAKSFTEDAAGNPNITDDPAMRADDKTSFRLIPTSLSVVYRFTHLADRTPVPVVPYGKIGLAYYIWWITKGDGSVTSAPGHGKARGATLGWQGSIGLALRADFLDPQAVRNLAIDYGIEHASFFAELTHADVSGLGQSERLRVGDTTWSAGVNFEF